MLLIPLKPFIVMPLEESAPAREKYARSHGVDVCISLMDSAKVLFDQVYPNDAKFHFSFFALFDGSALLCSAIMHDAHDTLPRRPEIIKHIKRALEMLAQLPHTETARTAYKVLRRLANALTLTDHEKEVWGQRPTNAPGQTGPPRRSPPPQDVVHDAATTAASSLTTRRSLPPKLSLPCFLSPFLQILNWPPPCRWTTALRTLSRPFLLGSHGGQQIRRYH